MRVDPNHTARLLLGLVPEDIRKSISADELTDRLAEASRLSAEAADPSLSVELRKSAKLRAAAVLRAQPRQATRRQHADLIAKAAATTHPRQAEAIRREAERLVEELHPIAPRRGAAVRKAKAKAEDPPVPVFNQNGDLLGVVDADDITPVAGAGKKADSAPSASAPQAPAANGQQAAGAAPDGQVAKASGRQVIVYDQFGRRHVTRQGSIRRSAVRKAADDLVTVRDMHGREYQVSSAVLRSPEEQARDTGPVNAGGTSGMGQPRTTGPDAALPGDGPQARRAGDAPGRTVVKAAGWADVHTSAGKLVGVIKQADLLKDDPDGAVRRYVRKQGLQDFCSVYDAAGRRLGFAYRANVLGTRAGGR